MSRVLPHIILEDLEEEEDEDTSSIGNSIDTINSSKTSFEKSKDARSPPNQAPPSRSPSKIGSTHEFAQPKIDTEIMENMLNLAALNEGQSRFGNTYKYLNRTTMMEYTVAKWELKNISDEKRSEILRTLDRFCMLRHPRIARLYGYNLSDDRITMFRIFVPSGTIADKLKRGVLAENISLKYFKQLMEGLKYLHDRSIVHGNIKASNVLMTLTNDVQLADMSLPNAPSPDVHKIRSLLHSAPELLKDKNSLNRTTPASDVWASGCVLVAMVTRHPPFLEILISLSAEKLQERLIEAHDSCSAKPLKYRSEILIPTASREFSDVVDACFVPSQTVRMTATKILDTYFTSRSTSNSMSRPPSEVSFHVATKKEEMNIDDLYNDGPQVVINNENEESEELLDTPHFDEDPSAADFFIWIFSRFLVFGSLLLKWIAMVILAAFSLGFVVGSVFFAIFVIYNGIGVICQCQLNEGFIVLIALILLPVIILLSTLCCNNSWEKYKQDEESGKLEECRYVYAQPEDDVVLCGIIVVDGKKEMRKKSVRRKNASPDEKEPGTPLKGKGDFADGIAKLA